VWGEPNPRKFDCYVPRVLLRRLATAPEDLVQTVEGTVVFTDVSGFTRLSERLGRVGKEGSEHLVDTINACFSALLVDAYAHGGSLLKFGGDALLLWFEGSEHASRACASAALMRRTLRRVGRIDTGAGKVVLRMSVGVHSGSFETFLVGESSREYLIAGPSASRVVALEAAASTGQILLSRETAAMLPRSCLGRATGPGVLLGRVPPVRAKVPDEPALLPPDDAVALCLSTAVRAHVSSAPVAPEHRNATVGFVQFGGLDELIEWDGPRAAAEAVDEIVRAVQEGADLFQVCVLQSDIAADGGKFQLTAGAPRALGDNEERMLLAARHVIDRRTRLPVRIGVNRGHVFTGEIGPPYRRTCAAMGDAVNLTARLMSKAPRGSIYAAEGVLERSKTSFHSTALPPFMVKGKRRPVQAVEVGPLRRPVRKAPTAKRLPLVGRDRELGAIRDALADARARNGGMIEIIGEVGSGKSRLLTEAHELADGFRFAHSICENYRRTVPYVVWRDILRQLFGLHWDDPDDVVTAEILARIEASGGQLRPWLPLLAIAFDVQVPMTREVRELATDYRTAKLHEVVLEFLEHLLAVPTLIQIEHGHFMDEASGALLQAVADRLKSSAWVITVTRRDVTDGFVAAPESSTQLALGPLHWDAMVQLAESTPEANAVPPDLLYMAVQRAGGSPEFLLDLLAAAAGGSEALPDSMDAAATARIDELDPRERVLVRRASVLGLCFHPRLLTYVLDPDTSEPEEQAWSRMSSIFADDGGGYVRFKRPALCEAAYEGLPYRLRRQLHAAVGEALEPELGRDADADPAVLSLHFVLAGDHDRAWKYAKVAAEGAVAKFAQADAARLYRRAIDAGRQNGASDLELAECWEALGEALMQSGQSAAAVDALTAARNMVRDDPLAQARLFLRHVRIAHRRGQLTAAVRWGGRGVRVLGAAGDSRSRVIRARLLAELAFIRYVQGRLPEAERLCRTVVEEFEADADQRPLAHASYVLDLVLADLGRPDEAVYGSRALTIYERLGDREEQGHVLNALAMLAHVRWKWDEALALYARAAEAYERAGSQTGIAITECNIGEILSDRGFDERAAHHLGRARRIWSAVGEPGAAAYAAGLLGRIAARGGRIDEARELVGDAAAELRRLGEMRYQEEIEAVLAEAEAFAGDAPRAIVLAEALLAGSSREAWLQRVRGIALSRLGLLGEAMTALNTSLATARERGALYDVAATLDVLQILGAEPEQGSADRDSLLTRLGIVRLPVLELPRASWELAAASSR
jgi:class 3 adenylate cyclase/tetratricopeptide (TPR) repeat protein